MMIPVFFVIDVSFPHYDRRLIETISSIGLHIVDAIEASGTLGFGRIGNMPYCHIFSHSGNQRLSNTIGRIKQAVAEGKVSAKIVGYILLLDSQKMVLAGKDVYKGIEDFIRFMGAVQPYIESISPFVIAVLNQHLPGAMPLEDIRKLLPIADAKLVTCDVTDKISVKNVFLELLKNLPDDEIVSAARQAVFSA